MALSPPIHLLLALLALPPSSLPSSLSNPHIHSSLSALLASLSAPRPQAHALTEPHLRPLLHAPIARLAQLPKSPLSLGFLALYLRAFLPANDKLARGVVGDALSSNVRLAGEIRGAGVGALQEALEKQEEGDVEAARTLLALVKGAIEVFVPPSAAGASGQESTKTLVSSLVEAYQRLFSLANPSLEQDRLRLDVLETAHALFVALSTSLSGTSTSTPALEQLHTLLPLLLPSSSSKSSPPSRLAIDLQTHFSLSSLLSSSVQGSVGPVARSVKDQLGALRRAGEAREGEGEGGEGEEGWLERLRRAEAVGGAAQQGMGMDKGEEGTRAGEVNGHSQAPEKEAEIASAISQLLDLFPSSPPAFLRACLTHPSFTSSSSSTAETTERVVAALLEDDLPANLKALRDGGGEEEKPAPPPPAAPAPKPPAAPTPSSTRQNIYSDDALFSRGKLLVGGKERKLAPSSSSSSSGFGGGKLKLDDTLKASIIALAERPSSDEEDEDEEGEAFLEDEPGMGEPRIRVGDGEPKDTDSEGEGGGEQGDGPQGGGTAAGTSTVPRPAPSGAYHPQVLLALESAYLSSPSLFNRDSATRRSKARKELRERTGLGDEQVEGWKSMLERDAKKLQKLREKHQDLAATANHPRAQQAPPASSSSSSASSKPPPPHQQQHQQQQQSNHASRGGRGGGQGGGGRGGQGARGGRGGGRGGQSGRKESDRAVRGRDRKMVRMGAGPPA